MPNLLFRKGLSVLFAPAHQIEDVATVRILHYDAERVRGVLKKGVFVPDHVGVLDAGQNTDLVQSVLLFVFREFLQLDFLHCVGLVVGLASHQVNFGE